MGTDAGRKEHYVHGYEEWTRRWMTTRTAERELAFLMPHLAPGRRVLDCGCGPGSITVGLARAVMPADVIGIDIEPRQLETARSLAAEGSIGNVRFEEGSIYEIPSPDASFDVAVAHFVIEHVSDPGPCAARDAPGAPTRRGGGDQGPVLPCLRLPATNARGRALPGADGSVARAQWRRHPPRPPLARPSARPRRPPPP